QGIGLRAPGVGLPAVPLQPSIIGAVFGPSAAHLEAGCETRPGVATLQRQSELGGAIARHAGPGAVDDATRTTSLRVAPAHDGFEREADQAAEKVITGGVEGVG